VPTCTPASCCKEIDASTWCGSDWSGIRPATSLTTRDRFFGATSYTLKSLSLIGRGHAQVGAPIPRGFSGVAEATSGRATILGTGSRLNTKAS